MAIKAIRTVDGFEAITARQQGTICLSTIVFRDITTSSKQCYCLGIAAPSRWSLGFVKTTGLCGRFRTLRTLPKSAVRGSASIRWRRTNLIHGGGVRQEARKATTEIAHTTGCQKYSACLPWLYSDRPKENKKQRMPSAYHFTSFLKKCASTLVF